MKKTVLVMILLGVVISYGFARDKYRILIRKNSDGTEIFMPMKKQYKGTLLKQWVDSNLIYLTKNEAENVIKGWIEEENLLIQSNYKKYIYYTN